MAGRLNCVCLNTKMEHHYRDLHILFMDDASLFLKHMVFGVSIQCNHPHTGEGDYFRLLSKDGTTHRTQSAFTKKSKCFVRGWSNYLTT